MIMQGSIFQKANKNDYNRWKKHILKKSRNMKIIFRYMPKQSRTYLTRVYGFLRYIHITC